MGFVFSCLGDSRHPPPQNSNRSQSRNQSYLNVHVTLIKQQNETLHRREVVQVVPEILGACSTSSSANRVKPSAPDIMESGFFQKFSEVEEEEDVCPTCLEDYNPENPKIVTKCSHHFHLACIYEWMERSQDCPVCFRVMEFDETA